jgi:DNA-binding transcriptional LysR family regulator
MELRHLRYFVAIAEERSFTRAAERLWVAQPGLSTQMRRLEAELGVQLFERHTRGVDLTPPGELFLERARATLAAAGEAAATGRDFAAGVIGTVRLGIATGMTSRHGPALLEAFAGDRPKIEITVCESYGGALVRDLRDGPLDAVIAPSIFASPELRRLRLGQEPWIVAVGTGHRLAGSGPIDAAELDGERIVVTGHRDGACYDRAVADHLAALGVTPVLVRGGPGPALFAAVVQGRAVAITTAPAASAGELSARQIDPERRVDFDLLWRDETPAPALTSLIRTAEAAPRAPRRPVLAVA